MESSNTTQVAVIGGGAAGSSAALVLGRARVGVVLVDDGDPSNTPSTGIGGLLGNDGTDPDSFYRQAKKELGSYPSIQRLESTATGVRSGTDRRWDVVTAEGESINVDRLLLATGMRYQFPEVEGVAERWGSSVFHCPFCHGWEHRDGSLAVLGGPAERALLLRQWSDDVTLITNRQEFDAGTRDRLLRSGIRIVDDRVRTLDGPGRQLRRVHLESGDTLDVTGLMVSAPHAARRPELLSEMALETTATGHIAVDQLGSTSLTGVWAAGDLTTPMSSVARAIASGSTAATAIVHDIVLASG